MNKLTTSITAAAVAMTGYLAYETYQLKKSTDDMLISAKNLREEVAAIDEVVQDRLFELRFVDAAYKTDCDEDGVPDYRQFLEGFLTENDVSYVGPVKSIQSEAFFHKDNSEVSGAELNKMLDGYYGSCFEPVEVSAERQCIDETVRTNLEDNNFMEATSTANCDYTFEYGKELPNKTVSFFIGSNNPFSNRSGPTIGFKVEQKTKPTEPMIYEGENE